MQQTDKRPGLRTRALALALALALVLGLLPGFPGVSGTAQAHWADAYLDAMVEWGFIRADQKEHPDDVMTRADFMAIINRAYGYTQGGPTPFEDVDVKDWFYDDVGIAYNANYIYGTSPTTVSPNDPLTRETSATILGRNMMLRESEGEILDFSDARDISAWARGTIKSSLEHYLVNGYDDGTFRPQKDLTWGEMAALVTRIVGMPIQEAGDYALGGVFGNVTITSDGVTLRDSIISGDLYITGGVGLGGVKLENVTVLGRIIASGSGESEAGSASIVLRNVVADELLVDNLKGNFVTVQADGVTEIGQTYVRTDAYVEDNTPEGLGLKNITLDGEMGTRLDLAGRIETVRVATPNAQVNVAKGTVASMTVDENAPGANVTIARGALINELNLDVGTYVSGDGDIKKLNVNAEGCVVTMLPEEVYIRPGITAVIHDQVMDSTSAEEAGRDPMILAGYPLANDIAPTTFQAVFATNKKGTVYWAVSPITDGSVGTDDLIHPPAYGGISVAHGSVAVPAAEELVGATVGSAPAANGRPNANTPSVLTPGGSYYLSAVFVDDRGVQSPTKVIALTLPDDSKPAFAEGYPYFSLITNNMAQITVMPTKSCKLYYAVLPSGAVAPTEAEFRSNAVVGNLGYGIRDVIKNTEDVFQVNDKTLEELESYDLYLWLVDSDGANKSEILKMSFTTVDKTPPRFDPEPTPTKVEGNSVGLTFQVNEDATVYWVVVPTGTDYPKVNPQTGTKDDAYSRLQIEKGMGNVLKSGNVSVKAFTDGSINVTGLEPESAYDFWYVAKDANGNYSTPVGMVTIYTLDTNGPRVHQYFTEYVGEDNTKRPTSDTDIILEFSENVRASDSEGFLELYTAYTRDYNNVDAKNKFLSALKSTLVLYKIDPNTGRGAPAPVKGGDGVSGTDWAIDYEQVQVKMVEGALQVIFKNAGLNLDAGSTYYFQITNLTDVSTAQNPIVPTTVNYSTAESYGHSVPVIEIEFAMVNLSSPGVGAKDAPYERRNAQGTVETETGDDGVKRPVIQDGFTTVDLSFRMIPQSTGKVDDNISYDVLLWADTSCEYDLYYRVLDKSNQAITDPANTLIDSADESKGTYAPYLLPTKTGYDEPDANGWFYLGASGPVNTAGDELAGKSVNGYFGGCDGTSFPQLNHMSEDLRYEFVITLRKIRTSTDRSAWSGEIHFHNYVAAGWSNRLHSLNQGLSWFTWETFQKGGLASGAKSIGMWQNNGVTEDYIDIYQLFTNTSLPKFLGDVPIFNVGSTSVTMALALDNPGNIYYVIGKANASGLPGGNPEITTTIGSVPAGDTSHTQVPGSGGKEWYILPSDVPRNGTGGDGAQPALVLPDPQNIFSPAGWAAASKAKTGTVNCPSVTEIYEEVTGLEANTMYYAYFVIKGAAQDLSRVYIYQFTTTDQDKPRILMNTQSSGDVELETDIASVGYYRTLTVSDSEKIDMLYRDFSEFVTDGPATQNGKAVPQLYVKTGFTLLDALTTPYNYQQAKAQCGAQTGQIAEDIYYFPQRNNDYTAYNEKNGGVFTVFDIYANDQSRAQVYGLIRDANPGYGEPRPTEVQWGPFGSMTTPANYGANTLPIGSKINYSEYMILTFAQNKDVPASSQVATFRATTFKKTSLVPPNLINVIVTENLTPGTVGTYNGKFTLYFDAPMHIYTSPNSGRHVSILDPGANLLNPQFVTTPSGDISVSNITDSSFTLEFKNVETTGKSIIFNGSFFCSESGEPATEALVVTFTSDAQSPYIEVTWGVKGDKDYGIWTGLGRPTVTPGGGVAFLSGAPVALGGDFNGYSLILDGTKDKTTTVSVDQVNPKPDGDPIVEWSVSPANIVTLTAAGTDKMKQVVTAVGMGEAVITVSLTYSATNTITQTIRVTVKAPETLNVTLGGTAVSDGENPWNPTNLGETTTLSVDLGSLTGTAVSWSVVSGNGVSITNGANTATATISYQNGGATKIRVTVGSGTQMITREFTIKTPSPAGGAFDNLTTPKP